MNWSRLFAFIAALGLGGCSMTPPSVSLDAAISGIQKDMIKTKALPISDFKGWTDLQKSLFKAQVLQTQCAQDLADPIVPIISGPTSLSLMGEFSKSGSFQVGGLTSGLPTLGFTGTGGKSVEQTLTVPVSFVSLSSIPSIEMQIMLSRSAAAVTQKQTYPAADVYVTSVFDEETQFAAYVQSLTKSYIKTQCVGTVFTLTNFVGGRAPSTK